MVNVYITFCSPNLNGSRKPFKRTRTFACLSHADAFYERMQLHCQILRFVVKVVTENPEDAADRLLALADWDCQQASKK